MRFDSATRLLAMKNAKSRLALSSLLLMITCADTLAAPPRKAVGWVADPYFVETDGGQDMPVVSHDFYPHGETSAAWTERILLREQSTTAGIAATTILDQMAESFRKQCPALKDSRIPVSDEDKLIVGLAMWHCPENGQTHRGQVLVQKVLVSGNRAFIMTAEGDYSPFEANKTPLTKDQLNRWAATQNSLVVCTDLTVPGCLPDANQIMAAAPATLTPAQAESVRVAETRGQELYRQDQLAWHATDYLVRNGGIKKSDGGGFIAEPGEAQGGKVYFFQRAHGHVLGATEVAIAASGAPISRTELKALPDEAAMRESALKVATGSEFSACSATINSAVLPAEDGNGWMVYLLTGTKEQNLMYLGGHTRLHVDRSNKLISSEPSAKSCLAMKTDEKGPKGEPVPFYLVTHLVSDAPWETHVMQSLTFGQALLVVTRSSVWRVQNGHIVRLDI